MHALKTNNNILHQFLFTFYGSNNWDICQCCCRFLASKYPVSVSSSGLGMNGASSSRSRSQSTSAKKERFCIFVKESFVNKASLIVSPNFWPLCRRLYLNQTWSNCGLPSDFCGPRSSQYLQFPFNFSVLG